MYRKLLILCVLLWTALPAWARLGGGSSYQSSSSSGGSSSYSSGGSGGGGGSPLVILGFFLTCMLLLVSFFLKLRQNGYRQPGMVRHGAMAGIAGLILLLYSPYLIGFVGLTYLVLINRASERNLVAVGAMGEELVDYISSFGRGGKSKSTSPEPVEREVDLSLIEQHDPNFSLPVFREFFVLLYSQAIMERVNGEFSHSRPYLSDKVAEGLAERTPELKGVTNVVVGFSRISHCQINDGDWLFIQVELESNSMEQADIPGVINKETWTLMRRIGILSPKPQTARRLSCPGCGFGGEFPSSGICPQCHKKNTKGGLDWLVIGAEVRHQERFQPKLDSAGGVEAGTALPTVIHPQLGRRKEAFMTRHPNFHWEQFWVESSSSFLNLQKGWTERDLTQLRPHETDALYRTHQYWIELYLRQKRINKLSDISIEKWELSNIVLDAFYESVTARVYATMTDVTTDEEGKVLSGNLSQPTRFSEYWTFIRRVGHKEPLGDRSTQCPSCGAPLDNVSQTGACGYCETVVTLGDFGWVLSNIQQDEVYRLEG